MIEAVGEVGPNAATAYNPPMAEGQGKEEEKLKFSPKGETQVIKSLWPKPVSWPGVLPGKLLGILVSPTGMPPIRGVESEPWLNEAQLALRSPGA